MTYGRNKAITAETNAKHRRTALRVFITVPDGHNSDTIFSIFYLANFFWGQSIGTDENNTLQLKFV